MRRNASIAAGLSLALLLGPAGVLFAGEASVEMEAFGETAGGKRIDLYKLENVNGLKARVLTYGATLIGVDVPDRDGNFANVTLHLDSADEYIAGHPLLGSIVGRYANRIDTGGFTIDGERYDLETVNAKTGVHIHGGKEGVQRVVWNAAPLFEDDAVGVRLTHTSPDGHEGFPGTLTLAVTYLLNDNNDLIILYQAETDKPTHVNLTNHAYFNLAGAGSGDVLKQKLMLNADRVLAFDDRKVPTGEMLAVADTPLDFREAQAIGSRIEDVKGGGYDHCYVINRQEEGTLALCAKAEDPASGRTMEVLTTQPGVQLYTPTKMKEPYGPYHGFCLETQHYPDAPNKPDFPSTLLRPGEKFREVTVFRFGLK